MTDYAAEKRANEARLKQLSKIMHTYGIAAGGASVALIVTKGDSSPLAGWAWAGMVFSLFLHAGTLYLAPMAPEKGGGND